jgi:hypothetical protein
MFPPAREFQRQALSNGDERQFNPAMQNRGKHRGDRD